MGPMKHRSSHGRRRASAVAFRLSRFSPAYRQRLLDGLKDLHEYTLGVHGCTLDAVCKKPAFADLVLGEYVICRFNEKKCGSLSKVKHALLGCQHTFPTLRSKIATCWANLKTWEEQRTSRLRPPIPGPIWVMCLGLARAHGITESSRTQRDMWNAFAVLVEIGFVCMLRPGELINLAHSDIALPGTFVTSQRHAALRVVSPKNRRQFGEHQFVLLKHSNAIAWLESIYKPNCTSRIWQFSRREFSDRFKQIMKELEVVDCKFTPASLRPGGATHYYGQGISIGTLRFMGRWTVEKSLEHYIQLAMATKIVNQLSPQSVERLIRIGPLCLAQVLDRNVSLSPFGALPKRGAKSKELLDWCDRYAALA